MTAFVQIEERTVPAFPLGQPIDGRLRYGMTPEQARVYNHLVVHRPHDEVFRLDFRAVASALRVGVGTVHYCVVELVERGWLRSVLKDSKTRYGFVAPVMTFKARRYD